MCFRCRKIKRSPSSSSDDFYYTRGSNVDETDHPGEDSGLISSQKYEKSKSRIGTIQVSLPNGITYEINVKQVIFVKEIIIQTTSNISYDPKYLNCYALRINHIATGKIHWLHNKSLLQDIFEKYFKNESIIEWNFELRVRFIPSDLDRLYKEDKVTFGLYYKQVVNDYLKNTNLQIEDGTLAKLCSYQIRADTNTRKKRLKSIDLKNYIPQCINTSINPRAFQRCVELFIKKISKLDEEECVLNFFELLDSYFIFEQETFNITYDNNNTTLIIGPNNGVATANGKLADFEEITLIETTTVQLNEHLLHLHVKSCEETIVISSSELGVIENLANLIDGYVMFVTQEPTSIWQKESDSAMKGTKKQAPIIDADYSIPIERNYCLQKNDIELHAIIAQGQFSKIRKGYFNKINEKSIEVAVKICNNNLPSTIKEVFLEEAYIMHKFEHKHIIKLIGIYPEESWLVMELAPLGGLQSYLQKNKHCIELTTILLFILQLSTALSYLESKSFVHKHVAIQNILLSNPTCIKLSGFNPLVWSKEVNEDTIPIRWMSPESIKSYTFTTASDVWSFAICTWELLTRGLKPYNTVKDADVIHVIESGERLSKPSQCPQQLFALMNLCWSYEPRSRPKFKNIKDVVYDIYLETKTKLKRESEQNVDFL